MTCTPSTSAGKHRLVARLLLPVLAATLAACGSTAALNRQGAQVKVVKQEPLECEDLGTFYGAGTEQEYAFNNLLNVVGESGGNRVYLLRADVAKLKGLIDGPVFGNDNRIFGRGFRCAN